MTQDKQERAVVKVENVTKEFTIRRTHTLKETIVWSLTGRRDEISEQFRALNNVSFTVNEGDTIALLDSMDPASQPC